MPPKGKYKEKSPGKDIELAKSAGLLDAYTDSVQETNKDQPKKIKNKKKREAEKLLMNQNQGASQEIQATEEPIDSWEDLEESTESKPRTIEFPKDEKPKKVEPKKVEEKPKKVEEKSKKAKKIPELTDKVEEMTLKEADPILSKLQNLEESLKKIESKFQSEVKVTKEGDETVSQVAKSSKNKEESTAERPQKGQEKAQNSVSKMTEDKSPEEIKAEREAKKKAKQAAKEAAKAKKSEPKNPESVPKEAKNSEAEESKTSVEDKSAEDIKAEREAKKKAKQAAKEAAKVKKSEPQTPNSAPKEAKKEEVKNSEDSGKSKAELKAERRAKQEAQRAAKEAQKKEQKKPQKVPDEIQADRASVEKKLAKRLASQQILPRTKAQRKVQLFSHLHQYERESSISKNYPIVGSHIHPQIMTLGLQYAEGVLTGSNARCVALMKALKAFIQDFATPPNTEFKRDLNDKLKPQITFLKECRPISVSMGNAIRSLKAKINSLKNEGEEEAKKELIQWIDEYVYHNVVLAAEQIGITACEKICDGDVILTFGCSSLLTKVFEKAHDKGLNFRVIIADGRPQFEGKEMARRMVNLGLHCTYVLISSVPYIIQEVSKVFIAAHAVLANGCVMSRVGTSQAALVAKAHNVPVLVCCETYKFSERVQTDSFVFNELGDPDDLVKTGLDSNPLENWRDCNALTLLNLNYDVTPANLVDAIISEVSVIPGTSVPVILRLKHMEHSN